MCGLVGGNIFQDQTEVEKSLNTLSHRGTDSSTIVALENEFYLGHNRLSIQDLSSKSNQPFISNDGRYYLVYNGEMWKSTFDKWNNYLRKLYDFQTAKSDTELLLYFLIHHKNNLVDKMKELNGMFSFGFYDSKTGRLVLGRDFIGRIPLYYVFDGLNIIFGSEIKSLLAVQRVKYHEIETLRGGEILSFEVKSGWSGIKLKKYYDIKRDFSQPNPNYPSNNEEFETLESDKGLDYYLEGFRRLLEKSVDDELISDVPVATILSGGIDSSVITYLLSKRLPDIECFVVGMETPGKRKDDIYHARIVADYLGLNLHEILITKDDVMKNLENGVRASESNKWTQVSPSVPQLFLSKEIRKQGYKVVFGGEGADELFASYGDVKRWSWNKPIEYHKRKINLLDKLDLTNLPRTNKVMMGGEVELRTPFLSKEIVEFCMMIPTRYRDEKNGEGKLMKYILRKSFETELPEQIISRPKKTFQVGANTDFLKNEKSMIEEVYNRLFK